jgi:hypothetical protein
MAILPTPDVPPTSENTREEQPRVVCFPVDVPIQAEYDMTTGVLTIETPVVHADEGPSGFVLRLCFTSSAACGFVGVLRALQDEGTSFNEQSAGVGLQ